MLKEFSEKLRFSVRKDSLLNLIEFFDHENVVSLLDIQRPPSTTGYEDVYIITELMEADLHRLIYSK